MEVLVDTVTNLSSGEYVQLTLPFDFDILEEN